MHDSNIVYIRTNSVVYSQNGIHVRRSLRSHYSIHGAARVCRVVINVEGASTNQGPWIGRHQHTHPWITQQAKEQGNTRRIE